MGYFMTQKGFRGKRCLVCRLFENVKEMWQNVQNFQTNIPAVHYNSMVMLYLRLYISPQNQNIYQQASVLFGIKKKTCLFNNFFRHSSICCIEFCSDFNF